MGLLEGTILYSLVQTKTLVTETLPHLQLQPRSNWTLQLTTIPLPHVGYDQSYPYTMSCQSIALMGRSYLSKLTLGRLEDSAPQTIIIDKRVQGLQFALGRLGIRGVRILYGDSTYSPWLGESQTCWVGTIRCCDLSKLIVTSDVSDSLFQGSVHLYCYTLLHTLQARSRMSYSA